MIRSFLLFCSLYNRLQVKLNFVIIHIDLYTRNRMMNEDSNHLDQLEQYYATEKLNRMINALPDDVARHIYEEYFLVKDSCDAFLNMLKSRSSSSLDYKPLLIPAKRLLNHPCAVEYLCLKNPLFKQVYSDHYVKNKNNFIYMTTLESFLLSILMHMYH